VHGLNKGAAFTSPTPRRLFLDVVLTNGRTKSVYSLAGGLVKSIPSTWKALFVRHRVTVQDAAFVIGILLLVGLATYEFSFTGSVEADKRIEFEEMLLLGALVVFSILYLGWRRVRDQEREIKRRIEAERRSHELAHTDPLTGLANRRALEKAVKMATDAPPGAQEFHALFMIDLNGFKKINDVFGHPEGDDVLAAVAARLREVMRERDVLARLGGDEFAIVAHHLSGAEGATNIAVRIQTALQQPIENDGHTHRVSAGVGVALIPRDGNEATEIIRKADIALYRAKSAPQGALRFFEEDMDRHVRERDFLERELSTAIGTDALRPWYQPITDLKRARVVEFEALARWMHPTLGDIPPDRFIPIAESCGLMKDLSDWLLRCAARDAMSWPSDITLSFNISPSQLKDPALTLRIMQILGETGLSPSRLEIEITESAIVQDLDSARTVLTSLRDAGIRIALDDFGTGYSSLYHLRMFKLDKIKIDRSFVHAMETEPESAAIVRALMGLGHGLGLTVTAEGIETTGELDALTKAGCEEGQGFLFSKAVCARDTRNFFGFIESYRAG
jgi:diguanylate cyclase (GGDEF)-like protein